MTWYAIRTAPGAQLPQREYVVEPTSLGKDGRPRGKGYRLVPSLNPDVSAIERSLQQAGFMCFMPVVRRLHRDRRKFGVWKSRRFPLLQGYVFVSDVRDWRTLDELPGVSGIVGTLGRPLPVRQADIDLLVKAEQEAEEAFRKEQARREQADAIQARKIPRRKLGKAFKPGSQVAILKGHAAGRDAQIKSVDRDGRLKAIVEGLESMGTISIAADEVSLYAA